MYASDSTPTVQEIGFLLILEWMAGMTDLDGLTRLARPILKLLAPRLVGMLQELQLLRMHPPAALIILRILPLQVHHSMELLFKVTSPASSAPEQLWLRIACGRMLPS